jgi:tripartite-type tricarboxylate transporter receptor subunit TctC
MPIVNHVAHQLRRQLFWCFGWLEQARLAAEIRLSCETGDEKKNSKERVMNGLYRCTAVVLALAAMPAFAVADDYPTKPIKLVVTTAPGGLMDVAARVTADYLGKSLGQRVVIENRAGVGGNVGAEAVARAEPDGYTLAQIQLGNIAINPYVYTDMTFDPLTDLVPVAPLTSSAILVVANAKVPANNLSELIALAKREPGKLSYGSAGPGTVPHLAGELFKQQAGVDILHVPYRGAGPAVNDMLGGHVQLTFLGWGAVRAPVEAGQAKVLAVAQVKRLSATPQFPTSAEAGLPGYEFITWFGVVAPKNTPASVIAKLVNAIHTMQDDPAVQKILTDSGLEVLKEAPEQFGARMRRDHERFRDVVKAAKLKPQ